MPLPFRMQALARLRARRHRQLRPALEDRHLDGVAEGRLWKRDRQLGEQMRPLADEELRGRGCGSRRRDHPPAAELAGLALAGEPELLPSSTPAGIVTLSSRSLLWRP